MTTSGEELPPVEEIPAAHLAGRTLDSGWTVESRIRRDSGATGSKFSIPYRVRHSTGRIAFLKALNFPAFVTTNPLIDEVTAFGQSYIFERDLLIACRDQRMSRVVTILDFGEIYVAEAGPLLSRVPYLIMELAEGDLRSYQAQSNRLDCAWAFRALKHVLQALEQLHRAHTTHQDIKPSNVLTHDAGQVMKLGDLGRADRRGVDGPTSKNHIPGARTYAPPEQLYDSFGRTWEERVGADLYLAGSLGIQLFNGHCMTSLMLSGIPRAMLPSTWTGTFQDVLPFLRNSHASALRDLRSRIMEIGGDEQMAIRFVSAISQLTDPDPLRRGHPMDRAAKSSSLAVHRFVSLMDLLSTQARYRSLMLRNV